MRFDNIWCKALSLYLCSFLIAAPALANPPAWDGATIVTINEGDTAPFSGTLFSVEAAAQLLIDLEYTQETCQIETDRQLGLQSAQLQLQIDSTTAALTACQTMHSDILEIKNGQIEFLNDQLMKASRPDNGLWFALGIAGGVLVTAAAGWTLGQID